MKWDNLLGHQKNLMNKWGFYKLMQFWMNNINVMMHCLRRFKERVGARESRELKLVAVQRKVHLAILITNRAL